MGENGYDTHGKPGQSPQQETLQGDESEWIVSNSIPFADVCFECRYLADGQLPSFRGVTLRGALGHHLKKTVCHVGNRPCSECLLRTRCAYCYIFEGVPPEDRSIMRLYPSIPQPFVIRVQNSEPQEVRSGDPFTFGLRLFGHAIQFFPYITYAFLEIGQEGLGKDRVPFTIEKITQPTQAQPLYHTESHSILPLQSQTISLDSDQNGNGSVSIRFVTPTRIREDGKDSSHVDCLSLMKAAVRRISIMDYFYGHKRFHSLNPSVIFDQASQVPSTDIQIQQQQIQRYSGRQKKVMELRGFTGTAWFSNVPGSIVRLFRLAELLHLGKSTSFGFGSIVVDYT
jgi:hypothetical protein